MRWRTLLGAAVVLGLLLAHSPRAEARFYNEMGKSGPWMLNLKIGAAIGAYDDGYYYADCGLYGCGAPGGFTLELDAGFAVDRDRNAYLLLPLQFEFFPGVNIVMIPFGFQYDIAIRSVPGLYLYPRFNLGYAAIIGSCSGLVLNCGGTANDGFVMPEFGVKYVLHRRWNFGFEPFGLPIYFGQAGPIVHYRLMWYAGVNL